MGKTLAVLLLIGFLMGCGPSGAPTPTPDVPTFSPREATALVQQHLALTHPRGTDQQNCLWYIRRVQALNQSTAPFTERYIKNGTWLVTTGKFSWRVYENSLAVSPQGPNVLTGTLC